jgi:hypothetical protein
VETEFPCSDNRLFAASRAAISIAGHLILGNRLLDFPDGPTKDEVESTARVIEGQGLDGPQETDTHNLAAGYVREGYTAVWVCARNRDAGVCPTECRRIEKKEQN